jgi:DNA-binding NarL/FixJ family response regulator
MVVDDQKAFGELASEILGQAEGFEVVAIAGSGEEALRLVDELRPDLVIMDVQLGGGMNGFEATERTLERHPHTKVVVISMYHEEEYSRLAAQVGAFGFISKQDFNLEVLEKALRSNQRN